MTGYTPLIAVPPPNATRDASMVALRNAINPGGLKAGAIITADQAYALLIGQPGFDGVTIPPEQSDYVHFYWRASRNQIGLTTLSPNTTAHGGVAFTLTCTGVFVSGDVIYFNGIAQTTTFVNGTTLTCTIAATAITTAGTVSVLVQSSDGSIVSPSLNFVIT